MTAQCWSFLITGYVAGFALGINFMVFRNTRKALKAMRDRR